MSANVIDLLVSLGLGVAVVFLVVAFLSAFGQATAELQSQGVAAGENTLSELYIRLSPEAFYMLRLLNGAFAFFVGYMIAGFYVGIPLGIVGFFIPYWLLKHLRQKRVKKVELQLIEGLELLGNGLKSGLTLPQATELLVREFPPPISQEFSLVIAESRLGVEFTDALQNMAERLGSTIVAILASGVAITKRCGGDLSVIFANIAQTIRDQANIEGKLDAVTAQGRFQGLVLGLMPFALIGILWFIDRDHVVTLFSNQIGIWAFFAVIGMVVMAQVWIRKLLDIDV